MTGKKRKANSFKVLASKLEQDWETALELAERVNKFAEKVNDNSAEQELNPNIYAAALSLQHYYTCLETAFKRIVREIDDTSITGEQWHKLLLEHMAVKVEGVRPAFFDRKVKEKLDKLRRFRHLVRHGYEREPDWEQLLSLINLMNELNDVLDERFAAFIDYLYEVAKELEE
ncbi:hypothetical protein [Halarsenatibacter silvermanii]|uniref:HepT-like domain-containing protein n=1 Tax=Halarsenatibacter silvermanii TaxID=321763 RepID=A0A1G9TQN4_9FIRM|nr:hypothetical protein [Halarsenatibacter silvermanii]SDM50086.1 hypothetical protein SAMN04488692_1452 [Halarsenatibacter silvermanii]